MRKTPAALAVGVTAFAVFAGGGVAYAAVDRSVTLTVDGKNQTVHTLSGDVQSVLDQAEVNPKARDLVAPDPSEKVSDGDHIVVRHARQVTLTVDGETKKKWVTALNVDEALRQLGIRGKGMRLSADRSTRIPLAGMELTVNLPKNVSVKADDESKKLLSFGSTVGDAVEDAGVTMDADDVVRPGKDTDLENGMNITVFRVVVTKSEKKVDIAPPVKEKKTDELDKGDTKVDDPGKKGQKIVYYETRSVDGNKGKAKKVGEKVVKKPKTKVVLVGTKKQTMDGSFWTLGGWDWKYLARCESGMNPDASNGTHFGLYQFSMATWQSVGGSGDPRDASPEEQTQRAYKLIESAGPGQWTCPTRRL